MDSAREANNDNEPVCETCGEGVFGASNTVVRDATAHDPYRRSWHNTAECLPGYVPDDDDEQPIRSAREAEIAALADTAERNVKAGADDFTGWYRGDYALDPRDVSRALRDLLAEVATVRAERDEAVAHMAACTLFHPTPAQEVAAPDEEHLQTMPAVYAGLLGGGGDHPGTLPSLPEHVRYALASAATEARGRELRNAGIEARNFDGEEADQIEAFLALHAPEATR